MNDRTDPDEQTASNATNQAVDLPHVDGDIDVPRHRRGELQAMAKVDDPVTVESIVDDLRSLGIESGETLFVHSSTSALGWVCGGPQAVCEGLRQAITEAGTVVVPTFTGQYTDPSMWEAPPVPDDWEEQIRARRPAFRPAVSPARSVGSVPNVFRTFPDAVRSRHPLHSFAAWGDDAEAIVADHPYDYGFGDGSPLAKLYDRDASVLMLGTDHSTNTSLHLAESRADYPKETTYTDVPIIEDGERVRIEIEGFQRNSDDFPDVGAAFEAEHDVVTGTVAAADCKLFEQRPLVDFGVDWFERHR